ncbi:hypothetical protein D3C84_956030 [compost metagenome]
MALFGQGDASQVVGHAGLLVGQAVRRDMDEPALDHRGGGVVEGAEANVGQFADGDAVDVGRCNLHFDDQLLAGGNDVQQWGALADHAADGVDLHAQHHARLGGADLDALGAILGGRQAFAQVEALGLHFGQLVDDLGNEVLLLLGDLQFRLADLQAGLGDG